MASTLASPAGHTEAVADEEVRSWWLLVATGALWLVFGFAVLNGRDEITTVWTVAIFAGILFFLYGVGELVTGIVAEEWRWLHLLLGVGGMIAGTLAFAWPEHTFLSLAALIGWYMVFSGTLHLVGSLMARGQDDLWWTTLIIAIIEFLLAFWAIGYPGRSIKLLIVWIAAWALARGLAQIVAGFELRSAGSGQRPGMGNTSIPSPSSALRASDE